MCYFWHKWQIIRENSKWMLKRCMKCGFEKYVEKFSGGYQPLP